MCFYTDLPAVLVDSQINVTEERFGKRDIFFKEATGGTPVRRAVVRLFRGEIPGRLWYLILDYFRRGRFLMADKSKLGFEFPTGYFQVQKNKIAEFAAAVSQKDSINDIKNIYRDEETAKSDGYINIPIPLTFPTSFAFWTAGGIFGIIDEVGADVTKLLHSEEKYEYFAPICAGDKLTAKMRVAEMYERGKKERKGRYFEITVLVTEIFNEKNELVLRARTTFVER